MVNRSLTSSQDFEYKLELYIDRLSTRLRTLYFNNHPRLKQTKVETQFLVLNFRSDEDVVKVALAYFIERRS